MRYLMVALCAVVLLSFAPPVLRQTTLPCA